MVTSLLRTKLYIPPVRPNLVPRPRLIERLNEGLWQNGSDEGLVFARKLTLISAPAGFGKTTLLSEWLRAHTAYAVGTHGADRRSEDAQRPYAPVRVAWVTLDEEDNDPARFWSYVIIALQTVQANVGEAALVALRSPQFPSPEPLLVGLINEIAELSDPLVLVLDDLHEVTESHVYEGIAFLLENLPPRMHLVFSGRADPPCPLARLRARSQMLELRLADLRFTLEEATAFLNIAMRLDLSLEDVTALEARTEGWIAGLQMAAIAMQQGQAQGIRDPSTFIEALTGSDRFILDYLLEEVLDQQPLDIQEFLLQTSILDRMTALLCDAVTTREDSQTILLELEQANLFLVPLDNERRWYRYHRLFADLLRAQLQQRVGAQGLAPLHDRASEWYERNGFVDEAIDHALSAGYFERAAHLIEGAAEATLMRSQVATLLNWVETLPEDVVRTRPSLCMFHAWALFFGSRSPGAIESRLQDVMRSQSASGDAGLASSRVAPLRALIAVLQGRLSSAAELSRQALEGLPEEETFLRSAAAWSLSISQLADGDLSAGRQALDEVARMSQESGNVMIAVAAISHLAKLHMRRGRLYEARAAYERALELATSSRGHLLPIAGEALMGLGDLSYEWNDLEGATRYLSEGIELSGQWSEAAALNGYVTLARVRHAQEDAAGARQALQKAEQLARKTETTKMDDLFVALQQARLAVVQGDPEAATRWVQGRNAAELEKGNAFLDSHLHKYEDLLMVRALIAQERSDEALALLEPLLSEMERQGRAGLVIEIQVLKALALQRQGDADRALVALERALSLAEPGGYVRIFVDEGPTMAQLLYEAAAREIAPAYIGRLLAAFKFQGSRFQASGFDATQANLRPETLAHTECGVPETLIEPLSERELEVLALIAEGLSNREIAQQLFLSLSTIKWHTSNIYGKLSVNNRTQAVAKARVLGILPPV